MKTVFRAWEKARCLLPRGVKNANIRGGVADGLRVTAAATRHEPSLARACSHLAVLGDSPLTGDREGDEGDGFHWRTRVTPLAHADLMRGGITLLSVEVRVSWRGERGARDVTLASQPAVRTP